MALKQSLGVVLVVVNHTSVRRRKYDFLTVLGSYVLNSVNQLVVESHCPFQILIKLDFTSELFLFTSWNMESFVLLFILYCYILIIFKSTFITL